jgi:hypothetical protein
MKQFSRDVCVSQLFTAVTKIPRLNLGLVVHIYNPSTWVAEAGGSQVQG